MTVTTASPGSALYHRAMAYYEANNRDAGALDHKVWDPTPWVANVYDGSLDCDRARSMQLWCDERWGEQGWPIHGRPGLWYRGNATVFGWTWWGFATEAMMVEFLAAWPLPPGVEDQNAGQP